jgi:hypothetical protein
MQVTDPDGVRWDVSRRWLQLPRWRLWRPWDYDPGGWTFGDADLGTVLFIVVLLLLLILVGIPLLVFLVGALLAVASLAARILFGRPWVVEAKSERGQLEWRVRGTRGSRRAMQEIAAALRRGDRTFSPPHAERLLPESPLSTGEPSRSVRVLGRRD